MKTPKTLAELKRFIKVGTVLTMTFHKWGMVGGSLPLTRKITHVQSNSFLFEPYGTQERGSWLEWPKAKEISFFDGGFNILDEQGQVHITYLFSGEVNE